MKTIKNFIIRWTLRNYIRYWKQVRKSVAHLHVVYGHSFICNAVITLFIPSSSKRVMIKHLLDFALLHGEAYEVNPIALRKIRQSYDSMVLKERIDEVFWRGEKVSKRLAAIDKIIEMIEKDIKNYS